MAIKSKIKQLQEEIKLYKSIEKSNAQFSRMSRDQKRISIAKDVLLQLKMKKYFAREGTYLAINSEIEKGEDAQICIADKSTTCNVCAIGALFTSKVKIGNKFNQELEDGSDVDMKDMLSNIKSIFGLRELRYMEFAFEGEQQGTSDKNIRFTESQKEKAIEFHDQYDNETVRLKAIMKNIIKNKGKFVL